MAVKKVTRKKLLKEPDEFISTTGKIIQYMQQNRRTLIRYALLGLIAVVALGGAYSYFRWQDGKAQAVQQQALQLYQQASAPGAKAEDEKANYKNALEKFEESRKISRRGMTGLISTLYVGHCHFALKDYDQAIQAYTQAVKEPLKAIAYEGLGYSYEAKGDYKQALENFQKNTDGNSGPFRVAGLLNVGRCYEKLNQRGKALEAYEKALAQSGKTPLADFIQQKIGTVKG